MNDSLYEDYMKSVLGYQPVNNYRDTYNNYDNYSNYDVVPTIAQMQMMQNQNMQSMRQMNAMSNIQIQELENCYPDIYRIVYPMVQKACLENRGEINIQLVDRLTDEIYSAIEDKEILQNRNISETETKANAKTSVTSNKIENKKEDRYCNDCGNRQGNTGLNDIIRILLLRELLGNPGFRPPRPSQPRPPRPPMRPQIRPQMRPQQRGDIKYNREYFSSLEDGYDLYEY